MKYKFNNLNLNFNIDKKLYKFKQLGGLDTMPQDKIQKLGLEILEDNPIVPASVPAVPDSVPAVPVSTAVSPPIFPIIIDSGRNTSSKTVSPSASLSPILTDKILPLITPPPSPQLSPLPPSASPVKPEFTKTLLFEILLENLLGQTARYKLYESEINAYFKTISAIYIIDFENLRYKFLEQSKTHYEATQLAFEYLSEFMFSNILIILCTNNKFTYENLLTFISKSELKDDIDSYSNVFTIYFNEEKANGEIFNFTADDDLLFWLYAMAIRKILPESCPNYQTINKGEIILNDTCNLNLITSDKQKLYDKLKDGNLKNLYTEFKKSDLTGQIKFNINNTENSIISGLIKTFLQKFLENPHRPYLYMNDVYGVKLRQKCFSQQEKCDVFEKFMRNIKTLQKMYFPHCDEKCECPDKTRCHCRCALEPSILTNFK